jgi:hypothetical protein
MLIFYKPLEMTSDMLVVAYTSNGNRRSGLVSVYSKLLLVIIFTTCSVYIFHWDPLKCAAGSLLTSYAIVLLCYDLKLVHNKNMWSKVDYMEIKGYVSENVGYGTLNLLMSLNSSMPRYFLIYQSNMAKLGLFSLLYQVAATTVNVMQYPISVKVRGVSEFFRQNASKIRKGMELSGLIFIFACVLLVLFMPNGKDIFLNKHAQLVLCPLLVLMMFLPLFLRGTTITAAIGLNCATGLYQILGLSILGSSILTMSFLKLSGPWAGTLSCGLYVIASSFITAWALLIRILNLHRNRKRRRFVVI